MLWGAIGSGKTTLVEETIRHLKDKYKIVMIEIAVIVGDTIAEMNASCFRKLGVSTIPVNTGKECYTDAKIIENAPAYAYLENICLLIIKNVGNFICPVDFNLGESLRVVIVSVTEVEDVVSKHPLIFKTVELVILNKVDIAHAVDVDAEK
ncbi:MAG: hydrogenase nickel incorporation protein HypB [Methanosarcina barkeri]|nr:hydrogenase nickel incorporation protein HypB [Methanosarcina sp. ERenArc_MAG2]